MENQNSADLDSIIGNQADLAPGEPQGLSPEEMTADDLFAQVVNTLVTLEGSLANMNIGMHAVNERIATLERFVSYLLSKDPEAGPKIKDLAEEAAKASNGKVL